MSTKSVSTKQSEFLSECCKSHTEANVRHICEISAEQDEIVNVDKIHWEKHHGKICH